MRREGSLWCEEDVAILWCLSQSSDLWVCQRLLTWSSRACRTTPTLSWVRGARSNCLIMSLDGTGSQLSSDPVLRRCGWGVAVLDFTDVFAPSMVFGRRGGLPGVKQTVPRSEIHAGIIAPRKTPLVMISDTENLLSTAQKGRPHPVGQCRDLFHQYWMQLSATLRPFSSSKSRAMSASGRFG